MRKISLLTISLIILFIFSTIAIAEDLETEKISIYEESGETIQVAISQFSPGSEVALNSPMEASQGYCWVSTIEPAQAIWKIYDPYFHLVVTLRHDVSFKQKHSDSGIWYFIDQTTFTMPAFAKTGVWMASCDYILVDGTEVHLPIDAETQSYRYYGFECVNSGDLYQNLFQAPWYFFNVKMPPLFWFPGVLLWGWLFVLVFLVIWGKGIVRATQILRYAKERTKQAGVGWPKKKKKE